MSRKVLHPQGMGFDVQDAIKYKGAEEAILLYHIRFWINKNEASQSKEHFHNGQYWTYQTYDGFHLLFPFWSPKQIRRILLSLESQGALVKNNFNKWANDSTNWYGLGPAELGCPDGQADFPDSAAQMGNRAAQTGRALPDITTDIEKKRKEENFSEDLLSGKPEEVFTPADPIATTDPMIETYQGLEQYLGSKSSRRKIQKIEELFRSQIRSYGPAIDLNKIEDWLDAWFDYGKATTDATKEFKRTIIGVLHKASKIELPLYGQSITTKEFKPKTENEPPQELTITNPFEKSEDDIEFEKKGGIRINQEQYDREKARRRSEFNRILKEKYGDRFKEL